MKYVMLLCTFFIQSVVGVCQTAVAVDNMNVLYIGVDNPVTIAVAGATDNEISATITGVEGDLTKLAPGKYIARVKNITDNARIVVTSKGSQISETGFRVRVLPDPSAIVGGHRNNDSIAYQEFRAQAGVACFIRDLVIPVQYSVTAFTLHIQKNNGNTETYKCQGNVWGTEASAAIHKLIAGDTVLLDDITVIGADGKVRKVAGLKYYMR